MFPITLPTDWQIAKEHALLKSYDSVKEWVCCESSLTVKVKELGVAFSVEVLNQSFQPLDAGLQHVLSTTDKTGLIREVVLKQGDVPLVYAQTVIPESTLIGADQRLAELGNQSLGQILFQSKQTTRGKIQATAVEADSPLGHFIESHLNQSVSHQTFIRRSIFNLNDKPLLVNECFLPALTESGDA